MKGCCNSFAVTTPATAVSTLWHPPATANRRQRGMTLVNFALMLATLLGVAALALDIGLMYTAHTSAQTAADAAALAGAFSFTNSAAPQPDSAIQAAIAVAAQNQVLGSPVVISADNVTVDTATRRVTVTVSTTINTVFAALPLIGKKLVHISSTGSAAAALSANGANCLKPIFVPNTALSSNSPDTACAAGQVLFDTTQNPPQLTTWAQNLLSLGAQVRLRSGHEGDSHGAQYYPVDFAAGTENAGSTSVYQCAVSSCANNCGISSPTQWCGATLTTGSQSLTNVTSQAINALRGSNPDSWLGPGDYQTAFGPLDTSRSVVTVPVWDNCRQPGGSAGQRLQTVGFVSLFISGVSSEGDISGYAMQGAACATFGGSGGGSSGPYGVPINLVQTQPVSQP